MNYEQAIIFLNSRIPVGWKLGLDTMRQMLSELGNPQQRLKFIHIAGTNGKGSVAAMLASILKEAGYKTGLYTSPHLIDVRERIRLNGEMIDEQNFTNLINKIKPGIEKYNATYFETLTALAFIYFADQNADIVVLETGLGGRLDATNVVDPELSIITSIDFDHMDHLGNTLADIAGEKAGIIKSQKPCLIGNLPSEAESKIVDVAVEKNAAVFKASELYQSIILNESLGQTDFTARQQSGHTEELCLNLNGHFQVDNACIAISACDILRESTWNIGWNHIKAGLQQVSWPGRFQIIQRDPLIILDVAHNPASMKQLVRLLETFCIHKKLFFIFGVLKDKNYGEMAKEIAKIADVVQPVEVNSERALPARELQKAFQGYKVKILPPKSISDAFHHVFHLLNNDSVLCITGSHYVVGDAFRLTKGLTK